MAKYLRTTRQARWIDLEWLPKGEIQSDAFLDLQTEDNRLSVYKVEGAEDIERVVVALAANRKSLANLDYATFEANALTSISIESCQEKGRTPDTGVNELHYDLSHLTVSQLAQLARIVASGEHIRKPWKEIEDKLKKGISIGTLDPNKMQPELLRKLNV